MYEIPSPDELKAFLKKHDLTGAQAGKMVGVDSRTIRRWTAEEGTTSFRKIPWSAWALLQLLTGEIEVEELKRNNS